MLKINIDPIVLAKLNQSFPKPANSAKRALDKYNAVFERLLNEADQHGRSNYEIMFNLFSLNLRQLSQKGPQIGPKKQRLHAWLEENGLQYYDMKSVGSNLNGLLSQVALNSLIEVIDGSISIGEQIRAAQTDAEIEEVLNGDAQRNREVFSHLYSDYFTYQTEEQRAAVFDRVPIDVDSLKAYIIWLNRSAKKLSKNTILQRTKTAVEILCVALHTGGYFLQRKKPSKFGRVYYSGNSVQSVSKDLRAAMLGDSFELDLRSSVIAFKLGFAKLCAEAKFPEVDHRRLFSASRWYVNDRKDFITQLLEPVFGQGCELGYELQSELIKQALTAISFGARLNAVGWRLMNGDWKNPALKEIFQNPDWHQSFINSTEIKDFIAEQQMLDDFFFDAVQTHAPEVLEYPFLKTGRGISKAKLMAFIYQRNEMEMMNYVRQELTRIGKPAIASIHDAVVVKRELVNGQLFDLNYLLRTDFCNEYLLLRQKPIEGYKPRKIDSSFGVGGDYELPSVGDLLGRLGFSSMEQFVESLKG
jgi:hypothetical protein